MAGYLGAIPVPQATQHRETFTATSGQTTFNTAGYTVGFLDVYLNGSHLSPADFTATNGSDVVLASGASTGDVCDIISYTAFEVNAQTFTGGLDVTGGITADYLAIGTTSDSYSQILINSSSTGESELRMGDTDTDAGSVSYTNSNDTMTFRAAAGARMALNSTGLDVTGTITADGLTVDGNGSFSGTDTYLAFIETDLTNQSTRLRQTGGSLYIQKANNSGGFVQNMAQFQTNGDISFYEDTGNTAKLFWDASAESLGIGVTPSYTIHAKSSSGGVGLIESTSSNSDLYFKDSGTTYNYSNGIGSVGNALRFRTGDGTERMRIDSSGNVGIGESNPDNRLHLNETINVGYTTDTGSTDANMLLKLENPSSTASAFAGMQFRTGGGADGYINWVQGSGNAGAFTFTNQNTTNKEMMRIDSSGNLLVGTTSSDDSTDGFKVKSSGQKLTVTRNGAEPLVLNRRTSDGDIVKFRKNNTTVGSMGAIGTGLYIAAPSNGGAALLFNDNASPIYPAKNNSGTVATADNYVDLGASALRFDDIFATNGTIQTSDRNEKQDIAALTSAEMLVAKRISALFKTFRWKDKVAAKGNDARTHTGIIAQDVQAAFTAESLDAGDYSLFISSTWWEHDVDVPAVEAEDEVTEDVVIAAVEEELDEEGNVLVEAQEERTEQRLITEAVEAVDAYTRTDTYDTEDEAPAGATSKTRMGIRYPELLSFVAAYNEQRFASIETRLTALEG